MRKRVVPMLFMLLLLIGLGACNNNGKTDVDVIKEEVILAVGMTKEITLPDHDEVDVGNKYVLTIDDEGLITTLLTGKTTINIFKNKVLVKEVTVTVMEKVREVELFGPEEFYLTDEVSYNFKIKPLNGFNKFKYVIENEAIMTIDEEGLVTPHKAGKTTIKIVSLQDNDIFDEIVVSVKSVALISQEEELTIGKWNFTKTKDIYGSIEDYLSDDKEFDKAIIHNIDINNEVVIDKNIILEGINSSFNNEVNLASEEITLQNLIFTGDAIITATNALKTLSFLDNQIENINGDFLVLDNYQNLNIINNTFNDISKTAIKLANINSSSKTLIEKNEIDGADIAISMISEERMKINSFIKIYRNQIKTVQTGFKIDLGGENLITNALLYARFNEVSDYQLAIDSVDNNSFEFTFNYWDTLDLDFDKFINIDEKYLLGHYQNKEDILSEEKYRPENPIIVYLEEIIDEIYLGDTFQLEPVVLPYTADLSNIAITISNSNILNVTRTWLLEPVKSGMVELTLAALNIKETANKYPIKVTTDPGIHFEFDNPTRDLTVGSEINITAKPFPFDIADAEVSFISSNTEIATVNENGKIIINGVGPFSITVSISDPVVVSEQLDFVSYDNIDENNILDFITQKQLIYTKVFDIYLHGAGIQKSTHNENVSRLLFHNYLITEDIIPVAAGFRPGIKFSSEIPNEYKYNDDNVVWIVVHDTGNNNAGSGAELHARYLHNQINEGGREASWHFTVDSKEAYQHMPLDEWAYHAGDGSRKPALGNESPALGGGNSNGIGIEMSIQRDGHIFKTWQNTAKLVADLLIQFNLPLSHQKYHNDFSGKECPQTLRKAGLVPFFEELVANEYYFKKNFGEEIDNYNFISHNEEILSNEGAIIKIPNRTTKVSYTIEIEMKNGEKLEKTFSVIVEGLWR